MRALNLNNIFKVVLITGGYGTGGAYNAAQIYVPQSGQFCSLPDMTSGIASHTQDGFLSCGGWFPSNYQKCSKWESGNWTDFVSLPRVRQISQSWTPKSGVGTYLIGGTENRNTTDLVKPDGTVRQGFDLNYDTT